MRPKEGGSRWSFPGVFLARLAYFRMLMSMGYFNIPLVVVATSLSFGVIQSKPVAELTALISLSFPMLSSSVLM